MNTNPNISVNIIVKNEERNIANAIASIQPIAVVCHIFKKDHIVEIVS